MQRKAGDGNNQPQRLTRASHLQDQRLLGALESTTHSHASAFDNATHGSSHISFITAPSQTSRLELGELDPPRIGCTRTIPVVPVALVPPVPSASHQSPLSPPQPAGTYYSSPASGIRTGNTQAHIQADDPYYHPPIRAEVRRILRITGPRSSLILRWAFNISEIVAIGMLLYLASRPGSVPENARGLTIGNNGESSQWEICKRLLGVWIIIRGVMALWDICMAGWRYWRAVRLRCAPL
jgi:hypothetical protein